MERLAELRGPMGSQLTTQINWPINKTKRKTAAFSPIKSLNKNKSIATTSNHCPENQEDLSIKKNSKNTK